MSKIQGNLQSLFGITKGELAAVSLLLLGLVMYCTLRLFAFGTEPNLRSEAIRRMIDSITSDEITSYSGSTVWGEPLAELAAGDTIIKSSSNFPNQFGKKLPDHPIDLNNASKLDLMKLPGIGEHTAISILKFRSKYRFHNAEDLMKIKGIGEKKYDKIKNYVFVGSQSPN